MVDLRELDIESLDSGGVVEELNRVLKEDVLPNIFDLNTDPTKVRALTLTLQIKPHKSRQAAAVAYSVEPKLPKKKAGETTVFLSKVGGKPMLLGADPGQLTLDDAVAQAAPEKSSDVVDLNQKRQQG